MDDITPTNAAFLASTVGGPRQVAIPNPAIVTVTITANLAATTSRNNIQTTSATAFARAYQDDIVLHNMHFLLVQWLVRGE